MSSVSDDTEQPARRRGVGALRARSRSAVLVGRAVAALSRVTRLGSGSVIGGRAALLVQPNLLADLCAGREVALVSATNGKTTTTRLLSAALATDRPVVSNTLGANMPPGHVAALGAAPATHTAVLEVDERWLGRVMSAARPTTVVLMNLSRDQLDRSHEVRRIAEGWRDDLTANPPLRVVANADDPLVAWAALGAPAVVWVAAGGSWHADAGGCPECSGRIRHEEGGRWSCGGCGLARPRPEWSIEGDRVLGPGVDLPLRLALPGRANRANAAMAVAAATSMGAAAVPSVEAMRGVDDVAGRYRDVGFAGRRIRLLLAKNPAGWQEALEMLTPAPAPVVVSINARVADGHDPSWLWDVPFEDLVGRRVVATGERRHDLAVRLRYAQVEHVVAPDLRSAVTAAHAASGDHYEGVIDVAANYTAFQGYLEEVSGSDGDRARTRG